MKIFFCEDTTVLQALNIPFAEVVNGLPLHPRLMIPRVEYYIHNNIDFATVHPLPFATAGRLIRNHHVPANNVEIHCLTPDQTYIVHYDIDGDFVEPWYEDQRYCIHEVEFYERYC